MQQGPEEEVGAPTVLSHICSPFEGGSAVRFCFFFWGGGVLFGVLGLFFAVIFRLRSLFGIHFGSELSIFLSCCGLFFFSGVLPMFLLYVLALRFRTCFRKIHLMSGLPFLGLFS